LPGVFVGLVCSVLFSKAIASLLFHVAPLDLSVFTLAPLMLCIISALAASGPLKRGVLTDPVHVLRGE
jgi:ABC-type lipoprotein release transport system permease subunit